MYVIPEHDHTCKFCISPYLIKEGAGQIVESSVLWAMKKLYSDGILKSEPVDVRLITEAEADERPVECPDSPIDSVMIYFRDKVQDHSLKC
jgi:hypothetical protein